MPDRTDDAPPRPARPLSRPFLTPTGGRAVPLPAAPAVGTRRSSGTPLRLPFAPSRLATIAGSASGIAEAEARPQTDLALSREGLSQVEPAAYPTEAPAVASATPEPLDVAAEAPSAPSVDDTQAMAIDDGQTAVAELPASHSAGGSVGEELDLASYFESVEESQPTMPDPAGTAAPAAEETPLETHSPNAWQVEGSVATGEVALEQGTSTSRSAEAWPDDMWSHESLDPEPVDPSELWRAGGPELRDALASASDQEAGREGDESAFYFPPTGSGAEGDDAAARPELPPALRAMNTPENAAEWSRLTAGPAGEPPPMPLAEALELLASRIRSGALQATGYEPGMGDAAALTAALAAVLGVKR